MVSELFFNKVDDVDNDETERVKIKSSSFDERDVILFWRFSDAREIKESSNVDILFTTGINDSIELIDDLYEVS